MATTKYPGQNHTCSGPQSDLSPNAKRSSRLKCSHLGLLYHHLCACFLCSYSSVLTFSFCLFYVVTLVPQMAGLDQLLSASFERSRRHRQWRRLSRRRRRPRIARSKMEKNRILRMRWWFWIRCHHFLLHTWPQFHLLHHTPLVLPSSSIAHPC